MLFPLQVSGKSFQYSQLRRERVTNIKTTHKLSHLYIFIDNRNIEFWLFRYFHRLNSLTCGNQNNEDYVCCPSCECGRVYPPGTEACGKSMVQGTNYTGVGAHPWVARIGFTSKRIFLTKLFLVLPTGH